MKCLFTCLAAFAAIIAGVTGSASLFVSALAQTQGTPQPVSLGELFADEDSISLEPAMAQKFVDAVQRGRAPGQCPKAKATVAVKQGDALFQRALVLSRRDVLLKILGDQARHVLFETRVSGTQNDVRIDYDILRDEAPPTLDVTWTPPSGTRVRPGDRIKVNVTARDDANLWQSGIKGIDFIVLPESNGQYFGFYEWRQEPLTCERTPLPRTLEGVYTVPASPPPIVRLAAQTKDFANHEVVVLAEFPTGDWAGRIKWKHRVERSDGWAETEGEADISLDQDGSGGLTGRMSGSHSATNGGNCPGRTVTSGGLQALLVGSYTPERDAMTIRVSEKQTIAMVMQIFCPGARPVVSRHAGFYEIYERAMRGLRPSGDGGFRSQDEQTAPGEAGSTIRTTHTMSLWRAQN